jgi:hypothetical protein
MRGPGRLPGPRCLRVVQADYGLALVELRLQGRCIVWSIDEIDCLWVRERQWTAREST